MIMQSCRMPSIESITPSATGCYFAASVCGLSQALSLKEQKGLIILVRLIDKAIWEYTMVRDVVLEEVKESGRTFQQIRKRLSRKRFKSKFRSVLINGIQPIYTATIIDHLENLLNALNRINKMRALFPIITGNNGALLANMRAAIEHAEERIESDMGKSVVLNLSSDAHELRIDSHLIHMVDIADELALLYIKIRTFIEYKATYGAIKNLLK